MIYLESIYSFGDYRPLYDLLKERTKIVNISHKKLPTWTEHLYFVSKRPYVGWYYILLDSGEEEDTVLGSIYLTDKDEVGIFIFKKYKGKGFGSLALDKLIEIFPGVKKFYANINPKNEASKEFFKAKGFKLLQETYVFERNSCKKNKLHLTKR